MHCCQQRSCSSAAYVQQAQMGVSILVSSCPEGQRVSDGADGVASGHDKRETVWLLYYEAKTAGCLQE